MNRCVALLVALGLVVGACSSGGEIDRGATQEALADQLIVSYPAAVTDDQARCVGEAVVAGFTTERLEELDLSGDAVDRGLRFSDVGLSTSEAEQIVAIHERCLDVPEVLASSLIGAGFETESAICVRDLVNDDVVDEFVTSLVLGDDRVEREADVVALYRSCFGQAELAVWLGVAGPDELALAIGDSVVAASPALVSDESASCLGSGVVAALGVERMDELGLTIEAIEAGSGVTTVALAPEETALVADVALTCLSYRQLLIEQIDRVTIDVGCVDAGLTDELLRAAVIETFTPSAAATAEEAIADVYRGCLRRVLALVPPGGALAFADVDLDEDEQFLADLLAYQLAVAGLEQPYHLVSLAAANCVGAQIVSGVGVERLTELGLTVDAVAEGMLPASVTLTSGDAAAFTEAVYQCVDARGALALRLIDDADVGPVVLGCLSDALPATLVRSAAQASATGAAFDPAPDAAFQAVVVEVFTECLDEGSLLLLGADPEVEEAP